MRYQIQYFCIVLLLNSIFVAVSVSTFSPKNKKDHLWDKEECMNDSIRCNNNIYIYINVDHLEDMKVMRVNSEQFI